MKKPFVSVVLSVFNDEENIIKTIKSVTNQSFKEFEFVIIDDN